VKADTELSGLLKRVSRSLYLSIRALPGSLRPVFSAAYLLCRAADTIADTRLVPPERRIRWIRKFPGLLDDARARDAALPELVEELIPAADIADERELLRSLGAVFALAQPLSEEERRLVRDVVREVCSGMETDLGVFGSDAASLKSFSNGEQLEEYCRKIGGGPGVFWTRAAVLKERIPGNGLADKGRRIGEALQMVNILRDTPRDLRIGRCYWPRTDLDSAGLSLADMLRPELSEKFRPVAEKWMRWAVERLSAAEEYVAALPKAQFGLRASVIWPVYWGLDTMLEVWKTGRFLDPLVKAKVPRARIYLTIAKTPAALASNAVFLGGYRRRRGAFLDSLGRKSL